MNILKVNFQERLGLMLKKIEEADFIAVDTEFTGFNSRLDNQYIYFDSLEDRYQKARVNVNEFWVCQLGICPFKYSETRQECFASPFNIYLLPYRQSGLLNIDPRNMQFLAFHNFDFTELFSQGVSCSRLTELDLNLRPQPDGWPKQVLSPHTQSILQEFEIKVREFCQAPDDALQLVVPSSYLRGLLTGKQGVITRCHNLEVEWAESEGVWHVKLTKDPEKTAAVAPVNAPADPLSEEERYLEVAGATLIFSAMAKAKKPIIGHNFYLDLALLYNHFVGELPPTLLDYKTAVKELFPCMFDTKAFAETLRDNHEVERTDLGGLFFALREKYDVVGDLQVRINPGFLDYFVETTAHDAGCDAFMTGYVYATSLDLLVRSGVHASVAEIQEKYVNKVCLVNHGKRYSDFNELHEEDRQFLNVVVVKTKQAQSLPEFGEVVSQFGDLMITQTNYDQFYVEFKFICFEKTIQQVTEELQALGFTVTIL